MHHWLANWRLRALQATDSRRSRCARSEFASDAEAERALDDFTALWRHGGSPLLRELIDTGTIELLGGPLAHPFQPLLAPRLREFALREGLADARQRFAHTPDRHLGARNAPTPPAWNTAMPTPGSGISWSTVRRCTATPRWAARSATPTSWRSGGTFRSATGSGRRSPVIPGTPPTATSTPTTTRRDSNRPASPDAMWLPTTRRRTSRAGRCRGRRPRRRLRRGGAPTPARRVRPHRPARARGRRVRHRTLRALVVRGAGVAGARVARPARGGHRVGTLSRCRRRGLYRCTGRIAAQLLGFRQGLAGVVG